MKLCDLLRPLMRVLPRQSIAFLSYVGAGYANDPDWKNVQPRYRAYFDRQLQCIVSADVWEWGGRSCYYWGRFFDVTHQAVLRRYLAPGDTYIDIGANVGYQSMFASRLVGPEGSVLSFEPNPPTHAILAGHIAINRIRNCRTFPIALSDREGEATLTQVGEHSGTSTLMPQGSQQRLAQRSPKVVRSVVVPMRRGDDVLRDIPFTGKAFVKIDVEGFEQLVLNGLRETLGRVHAVAVEVTPEWIEKLGGSAEELFGSMKEAGFKPLVPKLHWTLGMFGARLETTPLSHPVREQHDVLFVR